MVPPRIMAMPLLIPLSLWVWRGQAQTDSASPEESHRAYTVLLKQNLVLLGSILCILFIAMILLAVCVYKPVRRR
ncbi:hypothetical protein XENTR_v10002255 [Xenopus tropicalis]|nr:hypothetical protein XENTR_v10002255 [Xenopus tropicalis]